jgi:hypothetical protein
MIEVFACEFSFLNQFFDLIDLLKALYLLKLLFFLLFKLFLATLSAEERQPGFVEAAVSRACNNCSNETRGAADNMDD